MGLALVALAASGCHWKAPSASIVYGGTARVETSGQPASDLGHQEVSLVFCNRIRWRFTDEPLSFGAIVVGPECAIGAHLVGATLVGVPGAECTVHVDGTARRLRVTEAMATFGSQMIVRQYLRQQRLFPAPDASHTEVRIGGDESDDHGGYRHVLFSFEGPLARANDAHDECVESLPRPTLAGPFVKPTPPAPKPVAPARPWPTDTEGTESNGF